MLPVLIYDTESAVRSEMMAFLNTYAQASEMQFSILENTDMTEDIAFCVKSEGGIVLLLLGVGRDTDIPHVACGMERLVAEKNRDSYILYWLKDLARLPELAAACLHPVGFVLPPANQAQFDRILKRVEEDYASFSNSSAETFLSLQSGGSMYRLSVNSIDYIEAMDKKVNIWTQRQCVTVYEKLNHIEEMLGQSFVRCHRSYLVNYAHIESVDFAAMELRLTSGVKIPLSRSSKERLKEYIAREGLSHAG
jgi:DNA-binding LytR/AlgR family response regulator